MSMGSDDAHGVAPVIKEEAIDSSEDDKPLRGSACPSDLSPPWFLLGEAPGLDPVRERDSVVVSCFGIGALIWW